MVSIKFGYIAYKNKCTLNNFYFARGVKGISESLGKYIEDVARGNLEENTVCIIRQGDDTRWWSYKLDATKIDGYIVVSIKK